MRNDHVAITSFAVETTGSVEDTQDHEAEFLRFAREALVRNQPLRPKVKAQTKKTTIELGEIPADAPPAVEMFHEIGNKRAIVQGQTVDQPGLLYYLTRAVYESSFDIPFGRAYTGNGFLTFHFRIKKAERHLAMSADEIRALKEVLSEIVAT